MLEKSLKEEQCGKAIGGDKARGRRVAGSCAIVHVRADSDQTRTEWMERMGRSEQWEGRRVSQTWLSPAVHTNLPDF